MAPAPEPQPTQHPDQATSGFDCEPLLEAVLRSLEPFPTDPEADTLHRSGARSVLEDAAGLYAVLSSCKWNTAGIRDALELIAESSGDLINALEQGGPLARAFIQGGGLGDIHVLLALRQPREIPMPGALEAIGRMHETASREALRLHQLPPGGRKSLLTSLTQGAKFWATWRARVLLAACGKVIAAPQSRQVLELSDAIVALAEKHPRGDGLTFRQTASEVQERINDDPSAFERDRILALLPDALDRLGPEHCRVGKLRLALAKLSDCDDSVPQLGQQGPPGWREDLERWNKST